MHGSKASETTALCAAGAAVAICNVQPLPDGAEAPDWIHILPAGTITTVDGRGPYRVDDAAALIADSLQTSGGKMPIDENHATDVAAPKGLPSPARGWMTELQARADGIWARVIWTGEGSQLVASKAYRGISPVIEHTPAGRIIRIHRASLVNTPNLRGLTALHHQEWIMDMKKLRAALGLDDNADEAAIIAAIEKDKPMRALQAQLTKTLGLKGDAPAETVLQSVTALAGQDVSRALQAQLAPIAKAAGLQEVADAAAVVKAVSTLSAAQTDAVKSLQSELATITTSFSALQKQVSTDKATAYIDGEIAKGRVGIKPMRDHYIARHAADPATVEKEIGALPIVSPSGAAITPPPEAGATITALNAAQQHAANLLGIPHDQYLKTLQAERAGA